MLGTPFVMLHEAEIRRLLAVVSVISEAVEPAEFARRVLGHLPSLVACDSISYNEVDPERGRLVSLLQPESLGSPEVDALFSRYLDQHPLVQHYRRARNSRPMRFTDVIDMRDLHRLEIYQRGFRPLGTEHQIALVLPAPPPLMVGIALNRSGRNFSERDREMLDLARGPLAAAYRRVRERDSVARALEAVQASGRAGLHVVLLDAAGRVAWSAGSLPERAARRLGLDLRRKAIADPLRSWLEAAREGRTGGSAELRTTTEGGELRVRYVSRSAPGAHEALVIDEWAAGLSVSSLRGLSLTRREAEVLLWVARGKTNGEIGTILGISPRTAQKHLERIYEKSGTFSRTGAVAWALERLGHPVFGA